MFDYLHFILLFDFFQVYKEDDTILVCKVTGDASLINRVNMPPSLEGQQICHFLYIIDNK